MENQTSLVQIAPPKKRIYPPKKTRVDKYPTLSDQNTKQSPYNFSKTITYGDIDGALKRGKLPVDIKAIKMSKGLPTIYMAATVGQKIRDEEKVVGFASRLQYYKGELKDINDIEKIKQNINNKDLPIKLRKFLVICLKNFNKYYDFHYKFFYSNYKSMQESYFMPKLSYMINKNYN